MLEFKTAPGRAAKIPAAVLVQLQQKLQDPEGFESYGEVQQWLAQQSGALPIEWYATNSSRSSATRKRLPRVLMALKPMKWLKKNSKKNCLTS